MEKSHVHGLEDNSVKMAILLKLIYRFNAISIKIQKTFFCRNEKITLKFIWNCKGFSKSQNKQSQSNCKIKIKLENLYFPTLKHTIKLQKSKQCCIGRMVDLRNRTESPEINPDIRGQLIFNQGAKTIQQGRDQSFEQMVLK